MMSPQSTKVFVYEVLTCPFTHLNETNFCASFDTQVPNVGAGLEVYINAVKAKSSLGPEVRQIYLNEAMNMSEEEEEMITQVIMAQGLHKGQGASGD